MGEGAGPGSPADVAVFTRATFSVKAVRGMQRAKYLGVPVDIHQRTGVHRAATKGQEPGRINISEVGDEADAVTVADLEPSVNGSILHFRYRHSGSAHPAPRDTPVRRS